MQKNEPSIVIREGSPQDAGIIFGITGLSFSDYNNSEVPPGALDETEEVIRKELSEGGQMAVICDVDGEPAGCARFYLEDGLYFRRLGVMPQYRGKGISGMIIDWLEDYARGMGVSRIWCRTRSSWRRNIRIYSKLGFAITKEVVKEKNGHRIGVTTFSKKN